MLKLAGELIEGQLADHMVELDAHTRDFFETYRTGQYMPLTTGGLTAVAMVANKIYATPFVVRRAITIDRIAIAVSALAAGASARLGIYNNGTNHHPGSLVLDAGEVSVATTGTKAITISRALAKGLYWMAFVSDGAPSCRVQAVGETLVGFNAAISVAYLGWSASFTYAALPDPFPASAVTQYTPGVFVRLLSLD